MFLGEPFSEVHQFATLRTKWLELAGEPSSGFATRRAFDLRRSAHVRSAADFSTDRFQIRGDADRNGPLDGADFQDRLCVGDDLVELRGRDAAAVQGGVEVQSQALALFVGER